MLRDGNWYRHNEVKQKYCEGRKYMIKSFYLGFKDIIITSPEDHYNAPKISYKGYTWFASDLEDYLWGEYNYDKYGDAYYDYTYGKSGVEDKYSDTVETDEEFESWVKQNPDMVYEWLDSAIENKKQED